MYGRLKIENGMKKWHLGICVFVLLLSNYTDGYGWKLVDVFFLIYVFVLRYHIIHVFLT